MSANVLIVDDSGVMRGVIRRALELAALDVGSVLEASNGIEALAALASGDVQLVLLDINMPVMNGVQFLERLRDDPRLANLPVVVASTEGSTRRIQQLLATGAKAFIRKPFQPEQLRAVLLPLLGGAQESRTSAAADGPDAF
jgi:two-component system chemotaxis response regulator CheY